MLPYNYLPHLNAILNSVSAFLLLIGRMRIRHGDRIRHRRLMISALISSSLFLVSYLAYHAHAGTMRFQGRGPARMIYLAILFSHTLLAAVIVPLVLVTLTLALKEKYARHRKCARIAFPVWLYVSVTGVIVYILLYQMRF